MATLDEFEARLQALLEVHLVKYLPGYKVEDGIAQRLASVMHANLREKNGETIAPNFYVVMAHPSTLARWHTEPRLLVELAGTLQAAGSEAGFRFNARPTVTTTADSSMTPEEVRIVVSFSEEATTDTLSTPSVVGPVKSTEEPSLNTNAFLIVGGTQVVPINRSVINIGRRLDNHIVIDDPRVSRAHAQLRIVKDRYVIFDLNSSGGTFVNGQRSNQSVLYPGDVISLAGVTIIFGQDLPPRSADEGKTEPGASISADRPTVIFRKEDFPE